MGLCSLGTYLPPGNFKKFKAADLQLLRQELYCLFGTQSGAAFTIYIRLKPVDYGLSRLKRVGVRCRACFPQETGYIILKQ